MHLLFGNLLIVWQTLVDSVRIFNPLRVANVSDIVEIGWAVDALEIIWDQVFVLLESYVIKQSECSNSLNQHCGIRIAESYSPVHDVVIRKTHGSNIVVVVRLLRKFMCVESPSQALLTQSFEDVVRNIQFRNKLMQPVQDQGRE